LWDITSLGSVQVVGFFDVAARHCAADGPIPALLVGVSALPAYGEEGLLSELD